MLFTVRESGGQGRQPRACAGEAKRSALSARFTKRTIGSDGPIRENAFPAHLLAACVHDVSVVGSTEAETAWRERPPRWPRARSQTGSDLVVASRHGCALCRRAEQRGAYRSAEGAAGILRSEMTDPAGVTALKRRRTGFGNRPSRSAGKLPGGGTPRATPCSPLRSPINLGDAGLAGRQGVSAAVFRTHN